MCLEDRAAAGLMPGSRWGCTGRTHRGLVVEILAVRS